MNLKKNFFPHIYVLIIFFICNTLAMYLDTSGWTGFELEDDYLIIDALYYTIITHTTVGYGDILPRWRYWKMMGALHSLIVFTLIINDISEIKFEKVNIFKRKTSLLTEKQISKDIEIDQEVEDKINKLERQNALTLTI